MAIYQSSCIVEWALFQSQAVHTLQLLLKVCTDIVLLHGRCKLEAVPTVVERLASLCILDLTNNQIRDDGLPMSLSRLPHLKAIGLKKNCLTRVPRMLGYVNSLQEIYLEENADLEVLLCSPP